MNDLRRLVYLQALGVDGYVSRRQVPGAALTRRLAVVRATPAEQAQPATLREQGGTARRTAKPPPIEMPRIDNPTSEPAPVPAPRGNEPGPDSDQPPLRFSLAAVSCGRWLWLEELDGAVFTPQQLQLVQAMTEALHRLAGEDNVQLAKGMENAPVLTQFDWPMHTNKQLDLGREAARMSAAAFIQRKLEQAECTGLILLGQACEERVPVDQLTCSRLVRTVSTAQMLRDPLLKKQAWQDLKSVSHAS